MNCFSLTATSTRRALPWLACVTACIACSSASDDSRVAANRGDASDDASLAPMSHPDTSADSGAEAGHAAPLPVADDALPPVLPEAAAGSDGGFDGSSGGDSDGAVPHESGASPSDAASDSGDSGIVGVPGKCAAGMVRIPAKNQSFMMGFDPSEAPGTIWACYLGKHQVTFTHDYCLDSKLVTQAEFSKVMGFNPSKHQTADPTLPVDSETWYDAVLYCNKKSQMDGLQPAYSYGAVTLNGRSATTIAGVTVDITKNGYRLPTNAEYEYAERANTAGLYFFSPTRTADIAALGAVYAWYSVNSGGVTQPVGTLKPNPWGLYDIVGNLFEWENDWEGPYVTTPEVDPLGPATGTGCGSFGLGIQKMAKGGSWHTDVATHMRISYHFKWAPSASHAELGFRCAATAN